MGLKTISLLHIRNYKCVDNFICEVLSIGNVCMYYTFLVLYHKTIRWKV